MRPALELRQLRAFLAVVDRGGYGRAAETLGVSQSTVSESIAALERAAGAPLLRRTNRLLATTPAGERLLPLARRMLALHDEMLAAVTPPDGDAAPLMIGANESVATYLLPRHLATLRARGGRHRFQVVTGSCAEIRDGVRKGTLDLGLVLEPAHAASVSLATTKLVVLAAPRDPLASRTASAAQLTSRTFSLSDVAGSFHRVVERYFRDSGLPAPKMEAAGSVEAVKRTVAGGAYLGVLPEFAAAEELAARAIVAVAIEPPFPPIVLAAVQPAKRRPAAPVRELLELLGARASETLPRPSRRTTHETLPRSPSASPRADGKRPRSGSAAR
jgi:DNA-binding transcriptional LysR family regulator